MLIAISLLSSFSEDERFQASGTIRLGEIGRLTRFEVGYMRKKEAESILTDFQFWQTVVSSKETKPRAAVVF